MPTKVTYIHVKLLITDFIKNIPKTYYSKGEFLLWNRKCFATSVNRLPDATVVQEPQVSVEKMQLLPLYQDELDRRLDRSGKSLWK